MGRISDLASSLSVAASCCASAATGITCVILVATSQKCTENTDHHYERKNLLSHTNTSGQTAPRRNVGTPIEPALRGYTPISQNGLQVQTALAL